MDDPQGPGPLHFAPVGPAKDPDRPTAEPSAGPVTPVSAPGPSGTPPLAPTPAPLPSTWGVREMGPAVTQDPLDQLPYAPGPPPPPPPPTAPPFLEFNPDGKLAEPRSTMSSRTAIAVVLTTLLVAAAGIVGIAMRPSAAPQVAVTPRTPQTISETYSPPPPTAFDRAAAGQKYLSAIGLSNQAQTTMNNMINADMTKPCTCPSGHFNASDALAYLPTFNSLMTQSISQLNALATTLPSTPNEDVTAVAVSLQDVKSQWDTFFTPGQDSQAVVDQLDTTSQRTTGLSAKARSDLGLPPP